MKVTFNEEKKGIEIRFDGKPSKEVLDELKANGFHWSNRQKMWYAKQTDERIALVNSFDKVETNANKPKAEIYDLFAMTRVDSIQNNYELTHEHDAKNIAAAIRKHLRSRFPMCKWSVRTSGYSSLSVDLKSSPFAKDSEELKAIVAYTNAYVDSWNYDNSDSMTDYFDYNFCCSSNILAWDYEQREMTVSELNISELFQSKLSEWKAKEEKRKQMEYEAYLVQIEEEREESRKLQAKREANHKAIVESIQVKDVEPYMIGNLVDYLKSKEDWLEEYFKNVEAGKVPHRVKAEITRELHMNCETYKLFTHQLLDDYEFLASMGGSATLDNRVNSYQDYGRMSKDEQKTVEWYSCQSIAVYCDNELKFVIDPQGYDYARYCYFADEQTEKIDNYTIEQALDGEEFENVKFQAMEIEDISFNVIESSGWVDTWNTEHQLDYIKHMSAEIKQLSFRLNNNIIAQIESEELKSMMFRVMSYMDSIQQQFLDAELEPGQKITIMRIGDMGMFSIQHVTYKGMEFGKYAQYDNAVKLIFRPEKKRSDYYCWYYRDMLVYDGWVDVPESVHYDIKESADWITKKSKFLSCDRSWYSSTIEYLASKGIKPIVNTYNGDRV